MKTRVRQISFLLLIIFCPVLFSVVTFAKEEFPTKPITLIVPYDAGGSTDQSSRALVNSMGKLAQPMNIVNKPGAGGAVGYKVLQTSKPDGYTLVTTYTTIVTHKLLGCGGRRKVEAVVGKKL
jgi:tripartite-type tricarboxylate transporter receptor subunit TctC